MKAFKGFKPDLTCRGFQFAAGETFEHDGPVSVCSSGFHACTSPLDVFGYYSPATSVFHEVELDDVVEDHAGDSKVAARKLTVGASIGLPGLAKAHVEYVSERIDRSIEQVEVKGTASNTGSRSAASNTGDYSAAKVSGEESVAIVTGRDSKAAGAIGCWLVLTERDADWHIVEVRAIKVDGDQIRPDTYYALRDGIVCEVAA